LNIIEDDKKENSSLALAEKTEEGAISILKTAGMKNSFRYN
jgi:hypothetical protein